MIAPRHGRLCCRRPACVGRHGAAPNGRSMIGQSEFRHHNAAVIAGRSRVVLHARSTALATTPGSLASKGNRLYGGKSPSQRLGTFRIEPAPPKLSNNSPPHCATVAVRSRARPPTAAQKCTIVEALRAVHLALVRSNRGQDLTPIWMSGSAEQSGRAQAPRDARRADQTQGVRLGLVSGGSAHSPRAAKE